MRRLLLATTALILLSAPVFADPPDRGGRVAGQGHLDRAPAPSSPQGGAERADRGRAPQSATPAQPSGHIRGDQNRGDRRTQASFQSPAPASQIQRDDRNRGDRRSFNDNRNDNRDGNAVRPGVNRDFNRDGRTDYRAQRSGPRHDFSGFRDFHRNFQASRRFRGPDYRRPAGWYSHRWAFGEFLPAAFFGRDYWLSDFAGYDLPPPPYGAVWVRVDRDALLIDEDSGEIITVEYGIFY